MKKLKHSHLVVLLFYLTSHFNAFVRAQQDTLRVMSYNVLNYGDGCQATNAVLHSYLKTITSFANPDILGMVKMASIRKTPTDYVGYSPYGFCDSIIKYALNANYPGKYAYCTLTNFSGASTMDVLFYNKNKLGFLNVKNLSIILEDFDLYKLFYLDPNLTITKDTTFLYVILNHTSSGTASAQRDQQDTVNLKALRNIFYHLPNLINMGDFNLHNSSELGYQFAINPNDTNFRFYDPPFKPDNSLSYPLNWDGSPNLCVSYLTTSTRQFSNIPNTCGTNGGAKSWYDHILLSNWIVNKSNYMSYVPGSYHTVGNDGLRLGISVNDSSVNKNASAPSSVINALFQLSNKYPVMLKLCVNYNTSGISLPDPVLGIEVITTSVQDIRISNPVSNRASYYFGSDLVGQEITITWFDISGRIVHEKEYVLEVNHVNEDVDLNQGLYIVRIKSNDYWIKTQKIIKE